MPELTEAEERLRRDGLRILARLIAQHHLALLTFASERDLLDCLIGDGEQAGSDERQAVLFNLDEQV